MLEAGLHNIPKEWSEGGRHTLLTEMRRYEDSLNNKQGERLELELEARSSHLCGSRIVCPDCLSSVTNPTGVKGLGSEPGSGDAATDHSKDGTTCKDSPAVKSP